MSLSNLTWTGWVWLAVCIACLLEHLNILTGQASPTPSGEVLTIKDAVKRENANMTRALLLAVMWTYMLWLVTP
jgi:hypothetical protein